MNRTVPKQKTVIGVIVLNSIPLITSLLLILPFNTNKKISIPGFDSSKENMIIFFGFVGCEVICPTALNTVVQS